MTSDYQVAHSDIDILIMIALAVGLCRATLSYPEYQNRLPESHESHKEGPNGGSSYFRTLPDVQNDVIDLSRKDLVIAPL